MTRDVLAALIAAQARKETIVLLTVLAGGDQAVIAADGRLLAGRLAPCDVAIGAVWTAIASDRATTVETAAGPVFVQPFNRPPHLIIIGAVHIAQSLAPMSLLAGYEVTIVDPRRAFADEQRFPGIRLSQDWPDDALEHLGLDHRTALVTLTHDPKLDDPALDRALRSTAFYIAALGSRRSHTKRRERLTALGHDDATIDRVHGPAGVAIGAATPAEIAVSILAQMTETLRQPGRIQGS